MQIYLFIKFCFFGGTILILVHSLHIHFFTETAEKILT